MMNHHRHVSMAVKLPPFPLTPWRLLWRETRLAHTILRVPSLVWERQPALQAGTKHAISQEVG